MQVCHIIIRINSLKEHRSMVLTVQVKLLMSRTEDCEDSRELFHRG